MEKNILIINIGSSSKKYHLYLGENLLIGAHFEHDKDGFIVTYNKEDIQNITSEEYQNSLSHFYDAVKKMGYIDDQKPISLIGIRLVAPGQYFTKDRIVDSQFFEELEKVAKSDLTHIKPTQTELNLVVKLFPDIKIVAVSDSSFHLTMPEIARLYAIPPKLASEKDIYRFGFHGISVASIVYNMSKNGFESGGRVIVCHLGSGVSVTALLDGKSVDTSMGYSPLEGLVMSSRVGNIDAGAVLCLAETQSSDDLENIFYSQSGLLALSGLSEDMRVLLEAEKNGQAGARLAVEMFVYNIRKYIGAYASVLGGVDAVVFSGTMGERSDIIRERVCRGLEYLNIHLDLDKNKKATDSVKISKEGGVSVYIIPGNEAEEMLRKVVLITN